jgi:hypothetical protein
MNKEEEVAPDPDQRLADYRAAVAGIRRGLAQANKGLGESVDEVFDEIERTRS